jgi:TPR repeat protein
VGAVRRFKAAAEQGVASAQNMLGLCFLNGWGLAVDPKLALKWIRAAADQNDPYAQVNLPL